MKLKAALSVVLVAVSCTAVSKLSADESETFTLDEVEAADEKPAKPAVVDTSAAVAEALGDLRWGISKDELLKLLKKRMRADLDRRIKAERDVVRQDALFRAAQEQARRLSEDYVSFDGRKTGWDVSPIAGEFAHGNGEAMLVVAHGNTRNTRDLYFFVRGKLWKWYRELQNQDSDDALAAYRARFGRGSPQRERMSELKTPYDGVTWTDAETRLTLIRRGTDLCLIFEDKAAVEQLAVTRRRSAPKATKTHAALDVESILMTDSELKARDARTY